MNKKPYFIAEVGINHNGDMSIAKKLIDLAVLSGCDAVKFQKRTVEEVYSPEELDVPRESPFGTTNREQKNGLEFGKKEYDEIDSYCREKGIEWFASAWDIESQKFLRQYKLKYNKVASAMLTIEPLLEEIASEKRYTFISTGMSTLEEIDRVVEIFKNHDCPFELMHCNSSYPTENSNSNLYGIETLKKRYGCKVGYSGHEKGIQVTLAAVAMGVSSVERHITLDRYMYGSDQFASIGPMELHKLSKIINVVVSSMGDGKKSIREEEVAAREKLSKPYWCRKNNG
jgi:N-acetylneuraminate synthase